MGFENPLFACLEIDYEESDNDPTGRLVLLLVPGIFGHNYASCVLNTAGIYYHCADLSTLVELLNYYLTLAVISELICFSLYVA